MYDQPSVLIAVALFAAIVLAIELGFRLGRRQPQVGDDSIKSQINAIQAAVLGVLALLLGFTFSLSLQRHDTRNQAVVEEANAIGTAYLRSQLLPGGMREEAATLLREYLDVRVRAAHVDLADPAKRAPLLRQAAELTERLWGLARQAAAKDPNPVTTGLFIQALNELIDSYGRRDAALERHVPEVVYFLLFATFLMAGAILGWASGLARHRVAVPTLGMVALIVVLVFLIIDLDRPRRGLIQVSQKSLEDLQRTMAPPKLRP